MQVSIVIPMYNVQNYIGKCLESILGQNYHDYEVILVNDGSTDGTQKICEKYIEQHQQFKLIQTKNQGPAAARKAGVKRAQGKYIMFLDADDWLDCNMLYITVAVAEAQKADMICTGHKEVNTKGHVKAIASQDKTEIVLTQRCQMMHHLHGTRILDSGPWAKLICRELFEGIDFCEHVTIGEDYFMVVQLLEKSQKVILYQETLYNRCIRSTSISRSGYTERHKKAFGEYMKWRRYLVEKYPELTEEITSYHLEYELAVITAMCRNQRYDKTTIRALSKDLREHLLTLLHCAKTPLSMKGSSVLIAYCPVLFIILFRILHVITGR